MTSYEKHAQETISQAVWYGAFIGVLASSVVWTVVVLTIIKVKGWS